MTYIKWIGYYFCEMVDGVINFALSTICLGGRCKLAEKYFVLCEVNRIKKETKALDRDRDNRSMGAHDSLTQLRYDLMNEVKHLNG